MELKELALERAKTWLSDQYDEQTRQQVQQMIDQDSDELVDAFYKDLEFGTGGMRGIMGVGTNRMNRYTIGAATRKPEGSSTTTESVREADRLRYVRSGKTIRSKVSNSSGVPKTFTCAGWIITGSNIP